MNSGARLLVVLCFAAIGCSTGTAKSVLRVPGEFPRSIRLMAVTDASGFALRPRMVDDDEIVVPLPPERAHLARVEVRLLVTRRVSGEIMDQQKKTFSWETRGTELHFYLPPLPSGDYIAEIRATSTVLAKSSEGLMDVQLSDRSQISFRSKQHVIESDDTHAREPRIHEFEYHFERHRALEDTPMLAQDERAMFDNGTMQFELETVLQNNNLTKVTLDCWASSDGESDYNKKVSEKRCAWFRENVLKRALGARTAPEIIEAAHGEDNPPKEEPAGVTGAALRAIQEENRVVILKVYTMDLTELRSTP